MAASIAPLHLDHLMMTCRCSRLVFGDPMIARFLSIVFALILIVMMILLFLIRQEIVGPPLRWQNALSREDGSKISLELINRGDAFNYLGIPDEQNIIKEYDNWFEGYFIRKKLIVIYEVKENTEDRNQLIKGLYYESYVLLAGYKLTMRSSYIPFIN